MFKSLSETAATTRLFKVMHLPAVESLILRSICLESVQNDSGLVEALPCAGSSDVCKRRYVCSNFGVGAELLERTCGHG
jgi:hypothetical protein